MKILYPDLLVDSLLDIPLAALREKQIEAFIFDLDNTVTEWNSYVLRDEVARWFEMIRSQGFKACILSNNGEERVIKVARRLDIPYVHRAQKPRRSGFEKALSLMEVSASQTAVVGDQIFTDIWGGNRAGLYTILVQPLAWREFMGTKISRGAEYFVLRKIKRSFAHKANGVL
ncbi:MAG: YqeG family HAD IIIA-type phosphatase [Syntrophomonadaceae bacterium]